MLNTLYVKLTSSNSFATTSKTICTVKEAKKSWNRRRDEPGQFTLLFCLSKSTVIGGHAPVKYSTRTALCFSPAVCLALTASVTISVWAELCLELFFSTYVHEERAERQKTNGWATAERTRKCTSSKEASVVRSSALLTLRTLSGTWGAQTKLPLRTHSHAQYISRFLPSFLPSSAASALAPLWIRTGCLYANLRLGRHTHVHDTHTRTLNIPLCFAAPSLRWTTLQQGFAG